MPQVIQFAGLSRAGQLVPRPTRPWIIDLSAIQPCAGLETGDTHDFEALPDMASWTLGDTPADPSLRLQWVRVEDGPKTLLICDRVLLMRVSWDDLHAAGLVEGRSVLIDGRRHLCRLLSGGTRFRRPEDGVEGSEPADNEWDHYVCGGADLDGLIHPGSSDLKGVLRAEDCLSSHNQVWNWFGAHSWTKDPFELRPTARCCRGFWSARFFYLNTRSHRHEDIGWRPVLEPLD